MRQALSTDNEQVGKRYAVECLRCGSFRTVERERHERLDPGECQGCGYVGWALAADLSEPVRKTLRERPPEYRSRQLRPV